MKKMAIIVLVILALCGLVHADSFDVSSKSKHIEIAGGNEYETAVRLPLAQEFRLSNPREKGYYNFLLIDVKKGQHLEITANALKSEGANCSVRMILQNQDRVLIESRTLSECQSQAEISFMAVESGQYYLLLESSQPRSLNELVFYQVNVLELKDSNSGLDAGDDIYSSLPVGLDQEIKGYLSSNDYSDLYHFRGLAGQKVRIKIESDRSPRMSLSATVRSNVGQVFDSLIAIGVSKNNSQEIILPVDGIYSIDISCFKRTRAIMNMEIPHGNCFSSVSNRGRYKDYRLMLSLVEQELLNDSWEIRGDL